MDFISFIPSFGHVLWTVLAFVVALSIIVFVHEYGHYIVGRWSGIQADVFSIGFGPVLASRVDRRGTRWQIAALPFGGYVKFKGDADAASSPDGRALEGMSAQEARSTMQGAPLWARTATVAAGPIFNFIFSLVIFAGFALIMGVASERAVVGAIKPAPFVGQNLLPGDEILAVEGQEVTGLGDFLRKAQGFTDVETVLYRVKRGGEVIEFKGPQPFPPRADAVQPGSAAAEGGMKAGDVVLSIDGTPLTSFTTLRDLVGASDGQEMQLSLWRDGQVLEATLTPRRMDIPRAEGGFETRWLIGLSSGLLFEPELRHPSVIEAVTLGSSQIWGIITTSLSGLVHMVTGAISSCNLSGPLGIAESSGAAAMAGGQSFILFIAMLSTAVGLMNLFPVPVLDGGHLVFYAWEAVTGKPPSDGALRILMTAGLALLLTMMAFALGNDLFCP